MKWWEYAGNGALLFAGVMILVVYFKKVQ